MSEYITYMKISQKSLSFSWMINTQKQFINPQLIIKKSRQKFTTAMPKNRVCIYNKEYSSRSSFYLQDTNSDLFVVLNEKIYPLHISFLKEMEYFTNPQFVKEMVHIIESDFDTNINNIDPKWFQAIIGYYYGRPLEYSRDWAIIELLRIIKFVRCQELQQKIFQDIRTHFDEYGFFLLLNISFSFKTKWLKQKCEQQLMLMNFEQLNYNRFDFYQIDVNALKEIIKLHQLLRINQNIIGINRKILNKILSQYCKANKIVDIEIEALITDCQQSARDSWSTHENNESYAAKKQNNLQSQPKSNIGMSQQQEQKKNSKKPASTAQQQRNKIYEQISKMPDIKQRKNQAKSLHDMYNIDEKVRRFQKTCEQQDTKYENLKKQMEKLNTGNRKVQENIIEEQQQTLEEEKGRKQKVRHTPNKLFSQMPKLMQESDSEDYDE